MFHREIFRNGAPIVHGARLGAHVAPQHHELCFINILGNEDARATSGLRALCVRDLRSACECQDHRKGDDTEDARERAAHGVIGIIRTGQELLDPH